MSTVTVTSTGYGLRHKSTGQMVCVLEEETDGHGFSNEYQYRLVEGGGGSFTEFQTDTPDKAALVLVVDTPWYNSTKFRPSWGGVDVAEYEVVEVTRVSTVDIKPCDVPIPVTFARPLEERKTMRKLAERYLGYSISDEFGEKPLAFLVVLAPEGETVASLKARCTNQPVLMANSSDYPELCLGVFDLPEEYQALATEGLGVGLILTQYKF
jgi:hypothetical protein